MKKIFTLTLAMIMALSLAACGDKPDTAAPPPSSEPVGENSKANETSTATSQNETETPKGQDIIAKLRPFFGVYKCGSDSNKITIDEQGVTYGDKQLSVLDVTTDNYVKFNDSDAIFIMEEGEVFANLLNPQDDSMLNSYDLVKQITADNSSSASASESTSQETPATGGTGLDAFVGKYYSDSNQEITLKKAADGYSLEITANNQTFQIADKDVTDKGAYKEFYITVDGAKTEVMLSGGKAYNMLALSFVQTKQDQWYGGFVGDYDSGSGSRKLSVAADGVVTYKAKDGTTYTGQLDKTVSQTSTIWVAVTGGSGDKLKMTYTLDYSAVSVELYNGDTYMGEGDNFARK